MNLRLPRACMALVPVLLFPVSHVLSGEVLIPAHSLWRFIPVTEEIGQDWRGLEFDDSAWASGYAQLGYGDQDEITLVPFVEGTSGTKNISTYFRRYFTVTNRAGITNLNIRLLRDDGAVVYLNGEELTRDNMPTGTISHATLALTSIQSPEENTVFVSHYASSSALREGTNVLAVEIHQVNGTSADISFDLELIANVPSRAPDVEIVTPYPGAAYVPGASVAIAATASDADGSIARVEFYAGALKVGEAAAAPFTFEWSNAPVGVHGLSARAVDNTGVSSNTLPLLIRVGGLELVSTGAVWRYLDDHTDPGVAWREPGFDASGWSNGAAQFGFGDGDEATELRWVIGTVPIITAYFRREFVAPSPSHFSSLMLRMLRDDGGIVYLNGVEVFRSNMPAGEVNYLTYASYSVPSGPEEGEIYFPIQLSPELLVEGTNTLAAEVHQVTQFSSTDMSFDAELTAFPADAATRLGVEFQAGALRISWPAWIDTASLQFTTSLAPPVQWLPVTNRVELVGGDWTVDWPLDGAAAHFFRLHVPKHGQASL